MAERIEGVLRLLVVDDSAVVRAAMTALLAHEPRIEVTTAPDPLVALGKMERERPDVILLDLEMPRMHGMEFLRRVMAEDPVPVVVCSGSTAAGTDAALAALHEGAVSVIAKPQLNVRQFFHDSAARLLETVLAAARSRPRPRGLPSTPPARRRPRPAEPLFPGAPPSTGPLIAIGASTGGTEALREVLGAFPADAPPTLVVQHMPEGFTAALARSLDAVCRVRVREAVDGERVLPGTVLVAPAGRHLRLKRLGAHHVVEVGGGPMVSGHRPSVDVLFRSVADAAGGLAAGALLTGMGADGAGGLLAMRRAGAFTVAQDEATSVVFGMPREAAALGAARRVLPLPAIASAVLEHAASLVRAPVAR